MSEYTGGTVGPELTPEFWNTVFGWLPWLPTVSEPTAAPTSVFILLGIVLFTALIFVAGNRGKQKSEQSAETDEPYYESANQYENEDATGIFEEIEEIQQNIISTSAYEKDTRIPKLGDDQNIQMFYVPSELYPKIPIDGYLEPIMEMTGVEYDALVYFDGQNKERTASRLEAKVTSAAAETATSSMAEVQGKAGRQGRLADMFTEIKDGESPFKISTYALVRGETEEDIADARSKLKEVFEDYPVKQPLRTPVGQQREALQSVLPIGRDVLGDTDPGKYKSTTVAGAFGAAYASAITPTTVDSDGVEYGWQKSTRLPLILDPWGHDAGNAMVMVADPGGGKSTTGKALMQRVLTQREDVIGVTIEPMGNWAGVAEIFKSEKENPDEYEGSAHITVGGTKGINPLQIREIPPEQRKDIPDDVDPLGDRKSIAMSFLENFFTMRGNQRRFNEYRTVLENAISDAYSGAKIYHDDLDSHGRPSPTLRDVRNEQLQDRLKHPERYADENFQKKEILQASQWLYSQFEVFDIRVNSDGEEIKGSYANFGKKTEFDIFGNKYVYLDLGQSEGSVNNKAKLTMQILLDQVYEMSKQTDKKVVLAMDEFRYFIRDVANIDSIENLFRHHRHQDIAPWIMTQTVHEFLQRSESEAILDMCPYFLGQRYDKMNPQDGHKLGLSEEQYNFVSNKAQPGTPERGYADALLLSGETGQKLEVHLTDGELAVSEWDRDDPISALPGYSDEGDIEQQSSPSQQNREQIDKRTSSKRRGVTDETYVESTVSTVRKKEADTDELDSTNEDDNQSRLDTDELDETQDDSVEDDLDTDNSPDEPRSRADKVLNRVFGYLENQEDSDSDESGGNDDSENTTSLDSFDTESESIGKPLNEPVANSGENNTESREPSETDSGLNGVVDKFKQTVGNVTKMSNGDSDEENGIETNDDKVMEDPEQEKEEEEGEGEIEVEGGDEGEINKPSTQSTVPSESVSTPTEPAEEDKHPQESEILDRPSRPVESVGENTDQPMKDTTNTSEANDGEQPESSGEESSVNGQGEPNNTNSTTAEDTQTLSDEEAETPTVNNRDDITKTDRGDGGGVDRQDDVKMGYENEDDHPSPLSNTLSTNTEEVEGPVDAGDDFEQADDRVDTDSDASESTLEDDTNEQKETDDTTEDGDDEDEEIPPHLDISFDDFEQADEHVDDPDSPDDTTTSPDNGPDTNTESNVDDTDENEDDKEDDEIPPHLDISFDDFEDKSDDKNTLEDDTNEQEEVDDTTEDGDDEDEEIPPHLDISFDDFVETESAVNESESTVEQKNRLEESGNKSRSSGEVADNSGQIDQPSTTADQAKTFEGGSEQSNNDHDLDQPTKPEHDDKSEKESGEDPFGFGSRKTEGESVDDSESDESGDIGVLLDSESEQIVKDRNSDETDPFAQFEDVSKEDSSSEGNLGFLQDEETVARSDGGNKDE